MQTSRKRIGLHRLLQKLKMAFGVSALLISTSHRGESVAHGRFVNFRLHLDGLLQTSDELLVIIPPQRRLRPLRPKQPGVRFTDFLLQVVVDRFGFLIMMSVQPDIRFQEADIKNIDSQLLRLDDLEDRRPRTKDIEYILFSGRFF